MIETNSPNPRQAVVTMNERGNRSGMCLDFLVPIPLFAGLSRGELEALARDFAPRRFRQGEAIFYQGDPGSVLYLIAAGQVRIFVQGEDGQETSVTVYGVGDLFGELSLIDEYPRSASAVATEDTVVYQLDQDRLRGHLERLPQFARNFLKALSVRLRYSTRQMGSLALLDVRQRLARKLLELAQAHGRAVDDGVRIELALTQSDLAGLTGATRESVNKALGALRRQGLVRVERGHIVIRDGERLREASA
jgi:CRP/FNR family cyclic AMP-dependent transcriptional regulator